MAAPGRPGLIRLLLHGLQSPINVGSILRVAETFAIPVDIWDEHGLFQDEQKRRTISDFSCGAYTRQAYRLLDRPPNAADSRGRLVATCLKQDAELLPAFAFAAGDVIALGNEYDGLPAGYIEGAARRLRIPTPDTFTPKLPSFDPIDPAHPEADPADGTPVLSVAMTAGLICYSAWLAPS